MLKWWLNRTYTRLGLLIHFLYIVNKVKQQMNSESWENLCNWIVRKVQTIFYFAFNFDRDKKKERRMFFVVFNFSSSFSFLNIYFYLNFVSFICCFFNVFWIIYGIFLFNNNNKIILHQISFHSIDACRFVFFSFSLAFFSLLDLSRLEFITVDILTINSISNNKYQPLIYTTNIHD